MMPFNDFWSLQTAIFTVIFLAVVFVSAQKKTIAGPMSKETSNELRGLAILGILFAHLTYGKFYGTEFLFPLGIWSGPAVNLFFFLSGYGLAASLIYHPKPIREFYLKRVLKIYLPLWIFLTAILLMDAFILGRSYPSREIMFAFFGYYPEANFFDSINSPLWFLTPMLFYYLVFPLIFRAKHPRISVAAIFAASLLAFWPYWPVSEQVLRFYQAHWLAFPLGVLFAALIVSSREVCAVCLRNGRCLTYKWLLSAWSRNKNACAKPLAAAIDWLQSLPSAWRWAAMSALAVLAWQTAYHSGVGKGLWLEQSYALFTMACLVLLFAFKKYKLRFLETVGAYSFEIYLWHWPLIGRYDLLYAYLPPWLATALYLPLLLLIAYFFNRLASAIEKKIFRKEKIPA